MRRILSGFCGQMRHPANWMAKYKIRLTSFLTHNWEPCQAEHAAWPLLTQKFKYNSTKTGQDDETESRKTSKKEYIISNWFQRKKLHSNFGRLAKEKTHKLKPTLEILHAWMDGWVGGCQAMLDGKCKVNLELLTWPETPHTLEPILPAACEKNVFRLFRPSAGGWMGKNNHF